LQVTDRVCQKQELHGTSPVSELLPPPGPPGHRININMSVG
jgi:hypothetical protein